MNQPPGRPGLRRLGFDGNETMKTLPIALVLCGLSGVGLAGCQTVEDDGYYGRSYSTVEYRTGYRGYDYDYGYREPVRRAPPRYVVQPAPPVWHGGQRPPSAWQGGQRPPSAWQGGQRPPPAWQGGQRPPQVGPSRRPPPQGQIFQPVPSTSDIGR